MLKHLSAHRARHALATLLSSGLILAACGSAQTVRVTAGPSSTATKATTTVPASTTTTTDAKANEAGLRAYLADLSTYLERLTATTTTVAPTTTTHVRHRPVSGGTVGGTHANNPAPEGVTHPAYRPVRVGGRLCSQGCIPAVMPCVIPVRHGVDPCRRESGYTIDIYNPSEDASGKYQFLRSTWHRYQGYLNAADAPESVQDDKAREVWADGGGCSHWDHC